MAESHIHHIDGLPDVIETANIDQRQNWLAFYLSHERTEAIDKANEIDSLSMALLAADQAMAWYGERCRRLGNSKAWNEADEMINAWRALWRAAQKGGE